MERTAETVWNACLDYIRDNIESQSFKTWFSPIKPTKIQGKVLTVQVPSKFFYEWLEEHYIGIIKSSLIKELGKDAKLVYSIVMENTYGNPDPYTVKIPSNNRAPIKNPKVNMPVEIGGQEGIRNPFIIPGLRKVNVESQLNPNYNFENFIEGECNRLARSAGFAVAAKPGGTSFNPLLIYGGVGLGKTHLAHSIGIEISNPGHSYNYRKFSKKQIDSIVKLSKFLIKK